MPTRQTAAHAFIFASLLSCTDAAGPSGGLPENTDLSAEWPVATPAEQNLHGEKLDYAYQLARSQPGVRSLLVLRNGYLVREEYFGGDDHTTIANVHGVTTSILSALVGIAIREGHIQSVDQSIADFLVPDVVSSLDVAHRAITIRHLLTMTSGLEWQEATQAEADGFASSPYDALWEYALSKPVAHPPGTQVNYNSGAASILSVVLTRATGRETLDYAREKLLEPLGIGSVAWVKDGAYWYGGSGMRMRPRDAAKFGALYVNRGTSAGQAIIPESWITQSLTPVTAFGIPYHYGPILVTLGLMWWIDRQPSRDAFFAWGWGGQFVYCVPALKLVIVTTTDGASLTLDTKGALEKEILDLIIDRIIPSVKD